MTSTKTRSMFATLALIAAAAQACALTPDAELGSVEDDLTAQATITDGTLACNGATSVQVSISGTNLTTTTPLDLMLVVDESGSITSNDFSLLKQSLASLVNGLDDLFENGGRIGVVMFESSARLAVQLSGNKQSVLNGIAGIQQRRGNTCIGCGIQTGATYLASGSSAGRNKAMVVLTDGKNNVSVHNFMPSIQGATAAGITLYAVGVGASYELVELQAIATGDGDTNVFTASGFANLTTTFQSVVAAIVTPEATEAELVLDVNPAFDIQAVSADAGTVTFTGSEIRWTIPKIQDQTVVLQYDVAHDPTTAGGEKPMHTSVSYSDAENNQLELNDLGVSIYGCDTDSDGVVDEEDSCNGTTEGAVIDAEGCSIGQLCACAGPGPEHGAYVSCVAHEAQAFQKAGLISNQQRGALQSQAAKGVCID